MPAQNKTLISNKLPTLAAQRNYKHKSKAGPYSIDPVATRQSTPPCKCNQKLRPLNWLSEIQIPVAKRSLPYDGLRMEKIQGSVWRRRQWRRRAAAATSIYFTATSGSRSTTTTSSSTTTTTTATTSTTAATTSTTTPTIVRIPPAGLCKSSERELMDFQEVSCRAYKVCVVDLEVLTSAGGSQTC